MACSCCNCSETKSMYNLSKIEREELEKEEEEDKLSPFSNCLVNGRGTVGCSTGSWDITFRDN